LKSSWHHYEYTQSGSVGTLYIDGIQMGQLDTITALPSVAVAKRALLGTLYNWIGRSCYAADVYLRKALVYDFRLYKTALTDDQILTSELNVGDTIMALDNAYAETPNAVSTVKDSRYKVIPLTGEIQIQGLTGNEKVSVYDIAGSQLSMTSSSLIEVKAGVYIVKINSYITKVIVK